VKILALNHGGQVSTVRPARSIPRSSIIHFKRPQAHITSRRKRMVLKNFRE